VVKGGSRRDGEIEATRFAARGAAAQDYKWAEFERGAPISGVIERFQDFAMRFSAVQGEAGERRADAAEIASRRILHR
jgi:hypothetical protein